MKFLVNLLKLVFERKRFFIFFIFVSHGILIIKSDNNSILPPTVEIAIFIRNKEYCLPYFLGNLERLNYRKDRIGLFIRIDHTEDESSSIMELWLNNMREKYHHVDYVLTDEGEGYSKESTVTEWTMERYEHFIQLKEEALTSARRSWADFLFIIDTDVMIINEDIIQTLMSRNVPIISSLLNCTNSASYSNFWGDMTENGYYKRSNDYFEIQRRKKKGVFQVPMINSVYMINLKMEVTRNLTFLPETDNIYPIDDVILFAKSAEKYGIPMFIDNTASFGYIINPDEYGGYEKEKEMFLHAKFQVMLDQEEVKEIFTLKPSKYLTEDLPQSSKLGFDEIYLINLKRRNDRRVKMEYLFKQLGIKVKYFEAVDGKMLNKTYLDSLEIKQMPGYSDPYHKRDLKMGEIGCFLSHYFIWLEMIKEKYQKILIFEDDIRFAPAFIANIETVMEEAERVIPNWELLYIGRKRMSDKERHVENSSYLVYPDYTYWTLGYAISIKGVIKLLKQEPLKKMLAVDEFLPIMFDRHPQDEWKLYFEPRDLIAISSQPLLIEPTHYTGEPKYVSDTEDSMIIDDLK